MSIRTFKDLQFRPHRLAWMEGYKDATHAEMEFDNGYTVSVSCGEMFHSNGYDTYEVGIKVKGMMLYNSPVMDDVMCNQTADDVTSIMKQIQELKPIN